MIVSSKIREEGEGEECQCFSLTVLLPSREEEESIEHFCFPIIFFSFLFIKFIFFFFSRDRD